MSGFNYEKDANGVVTVTMDMAGQVNSMSEAFLPALQDTVEKLEAEGDLTGVVLASAKKTFFAGGDLNSLCQVTEENAETFFNEAQAIKAEFRRLEKLGKPIVDGPDDRGRRMLFWTHAAPGPSGAVISSSLSVFLRKDGVVDEVRFASTE